MLILAAALAAVVAYLTWPTRGTVFCEQLPELTALAVLAAALVIFGFRALGAAGAQQQDRRIAGSAIILAALALFLSVHFIAQYRAACKAVQQQVFPHIPGKSN